MKHSRIVNGWAYTHKRTLCAIIACAISAFFALACSGRSGQERVVEYTFPPLAENNAIAVKNRYGAITVRSWKKENACVTMTVRDERWTPFWNYVAIKDVPIEITTNTNGLSFITHMRDRGNNIVVDYTIMLPQTPCLFKGHVFTGEINMRDVIGGTHVDTFSGAIRISNIEGALTLRTLNGQVTLSDIKGDVEARTASGGIRGKSLASNVMVECADGYIHLTDVKGNITAKGLSGDIIIEHAEGDVSITTRAGNIAVRNSTYLYEARTKSGEIAYDVLPLSGRETLETTLAVGMGDITLFIAKASEGMIEARTRTGDINVETTRLTVEEEDASSFRGKIGRGRGRTLMLRTGSGDITFEDRDND